MIPTFTFKLFGMYKGQRVELPIIDQALVSFRKDISDYRPAFQEIAQDLAELVLGQFSSEGSQGERPWQQLAESTVAGRHGSRHPILVRGDGFLRESFTQGGAGHIEEISETKMLWGSNVPYALFHQTGTGRGFEQDEMEPMGPKVFDRLVKQHVEFAEGKRKKQDVRSARGMPRRKIFALTDEMQKMISSTLLGRLRQVARNYGFAVGGRGTTPGQARQIGMQFLGSG